MTDQISELSYHQQKACYEYEMLRNKIKEKYSKPVKLLAELKRIENKSQSNNDPGNVMIGLRELNIFLRKHFPEVDWEEIATSRKEKRMKRNSEKMFEHH